MTILTLQQALDTLKLPFELAPLQRQDIEHLAQYDRVGWFYEVGCGKTCCATVLAVMRNKPHNLVVLPPILIPQWEAWLREVDPGASISIYYGPKRELSALGARWCLTSHAIFRDDYGKLAPLMLRMHHHTIVDEAQALKSVKSKLYKFVKGVTAGGDLQLLTGTPTSKPDDAYSYISLKTPGVYRSYGHFENMHVVNRDIFGTVTEWGNLEMIAHNLHLQAVKRTKEQMFTGLKPPLFIQMPYDLEPAHLKLYDKILDERLLELSNGDKIDATTAQRLYHAMQQVVLNYDYYGDKPGKLSRGMELMDEVISQVIPTGSKLIIWTIYQRTSASVIAYLKTKYGEHFAEAAYGGSNSAAAVKAFMFDDKCRILVGQPTSVGVGLNAMHVCSEMLFLETSTVPMQVRQSIGRVDRVGQQVFPNIRFALANSTVQHKLFKNLLGKDDVISVVERNPVALRAMLKGA